MRQYNERVVLQAIRLHGPLAAAELARLTKLTAQTISLITKRLLDDGLLSKGEPVRGKVGQPSVPLALDPEGAYAVGIKLGRRSLDVLLVDFTGQVRQRSTLAYAFADPDVLLGEIGQRLEQIRRRLGPARHGRVQGVGIAAPLAMGGWQQLLGLPATVADKWQHLDLEHAVRGLTALPVTLIKDTAAACVAELVAGRGRSVKSFLYVFVDTFIGGDLVLDSHLRSGVSGNAGAIGSLPLTSSLPLASAARGRTARPALPAQLLSVASLLSLERAYAAAALDVTAAADARALQAPWLAHTQDWLAHAGAAIAQAVHAAACLLDMEGVILDGSFDRELLAALLAETRVALERYDWEGVARPELLAGTIGSDARALGAGLLPLYANFAPDRDLFLKVTE
jgi:predicted NBD/HSP70 family sugar kinase